MFGQSFGNYPVKAAKATRIATVKRSFPPAGLLVFLCRQCSSNLSAWQMSKAVSFPTKLSLRPTYMYICMCIGVAMVHHKMMRSPIAL